MPVAGALITAGGAVGSSLIGSNASSSASNAQVNAANNATNAQLQMYNQTRADQSPWRTSGAQALSALDAWYGLPGFSPGTDSGSLTANPISSSAETTGGGLMGILKGVPGIGVPVNGRDLIDPQHVFLKPPANSTTPNIAPTGGVVSNPGGQMTPQEQQAYMMQTIQNQPGYKFQFQQGNQAVQRNLAASGLLNSGAAQKELTQYGQGYASSAANDYLNGLRSMAGLGQTSVQATGVAGMNTANQIGSNSIYAGNAAAQGYMNQAGAFNTGLGGLTGALQNYWNSQQPTNYGAPNPGSTYGGYDNPYTGGYTYSGV